MKLILSALLFAFAAPSFSSVSEHLFDGKSGLYEVIGLAKKSGGNCTVRIKRELPLDPFPSLSLASLHFDVSEGSAGSKVGSFGPLTDEMIKKVISSKQSFSTLINGNKVVLKVAVSGKDRVIESFPANEKEYLKEVNSTFYVKFQMKNDEVVSATKKHWVAKKGLFTGLTKKLVFEDTCEINN